MRGCQPGADTDEDQAEHRTDGQVLPQDRHPEAERHDLAVLRALGMSRLQTRMVVATQASVLAVIGLVFGVPLGVALGRSIWRVVAGFTPLAYHPPLAVWALLLIGPVALLAANVLAAWPEHHAARLRTGQVLRTK